MNHPIVIVGAGIVGASIAWNLARRGKPVLILDQTGIGKGATGRSFGWINANFAETPAYFALRSAAIDAHHEMEAALGPVATRWTGCLWWEDEGASFDAHVAELAAFGYEAQVVARPEIARMAPALATPPDQAIHVAREGGADLSSNATLRTVIQKAKAGQMTNDAIDRAVKRGSGDVQGENYESITYEGYAPGGVAMMVDTLTNNRNRTGADVRNIFSKLGGAMAEPGAVGWQFSRRGVIYVAGVAPEDEIMMAALEAGADDISRDGESWRILSEPNVVYEVKTALEAAGIEVLSAESTMVSSNTIAVTDADTAAKIIRVVEALEENDDVQDVYANFDISDEIMESIS